MSHISVARGLAVCEQVIVEEGTKNVTLVNCFTTRRVRQFPARDVRFVVFAFLSDGEGDIQFEVMIQPLSDFTTIYRRSQQLRLADRMREVRFLFRIHECEFPQAGAYQVCLLADGELLAQGKFQVLSMESPT